MHSLEEAREDLAVMVAVVPVEVADSKAAALVPRRVGKVAATATVAGRRGRGWPRSSLGGSAAGN